ncbi:hypothetical protein GSI_02334 [Ganoderma sinense ZZ0214-1]|uniref:Uncharacterized protein n=1 Tax=Ganoderma sinense ZZ0214-1 TaxID=1077348 RepID=A0A2G8SPA8_9APHY|nr:hypothetical protein GSI_02334 [Ganoderma sinense ZZ0214-1]
MCGSRGSSSLLGSPLRLGRLFVGLGSSLRGLLLRLPRDLLCFLSRLSCRLRLVRLAHSSLLFRFALLLLGLLRLGLLAFRHLLCRLLLRRRGLFLLSSFARSLLLLYASSLSLLRLDAYPLKLDRLLLLPPLLLLRSGGVAVIAAAPSEPAKAPKPASASASR